MSPRTRVTKHHAKARRRRYRTAHERLARDRRQAQHATEALQQALDDLGLPENLVAENELPRSKLRGIKPPLADSHGPASLAGWMLV
jgi:hypothetical protein